MKYLSVCSGIEAASMAWHPDWEPIAFSEIHPFACTYLKHYYPDVPNWGDLTKHNEWPNAKVDVLVGGTPCQSFSHAGLRGGLDDPRGQLMLSFIEVADRYRPRWVVWENVAGCLSSNKGRDFGTFLGLLSELGYGFAYRVLDAKYFGVPQQRRRVFVVGYLGDYRYSGAVLFERQSLQRDFIKSHKKRQEKDTTGTVRDLVSNSPGGGLQSSALDTRQNRMDIERQTILAFSMRGREGGALPEMHDTHLPSISSAPGGSTRPFIANVHAFTSRGSMQDLRSDGISPTMRAGGGKPGTNPSGGNPPAICFSENSRAELRTHEYAGTLGSRSGKPGQGMPHTIYQGRARRLMPIECERLQGFPDNRTLITYRNKPASDTARYFALGNSIAVPVLAWLKKRIEFVDSFIKENNHEHREK